MANHNTTPTNKGIKSEKSPCSSTPRASNPAAQFSRYLNERFSLTPESMGMERRSDIPRPCPQQYPSIPPRAEISYERQYIKQTMNTPPGPKQECQMQPPMSSTYGCAPDTHDNQTIPIKRENSPQTSMIYNQSFATQPSQPMNLYSSMKQESLQEPYSSQLSCENSSSTQETQAQLPSSCFSNNTNPCSSTQQPTQQLKFYSCGNLPNRSRSEQPMATSTALSRCNISCAPTSSASSALQCLKSPGLLISASTAPLTADTQHCGHPSHSSGQNMSELPTSYYEELLEKHRATNPDNGVDVLNDLFLKRLQDIDENAQGDGDLKLITYQEWVDMLLNVNDTIITNMKELETEVAERLQMLQSKIASNCRHSQGNELMKCRKDIDTLIKFIRNAFRYDNWDLQCIDFETITADQIFGSGDVQCETGNSPAGGSHLRANSEAESMHTNKLLANISALAFEVAEKHDEVIQLKQQVISMEDEIQKAHQKIQLKDDVIKELRNDLKCGHNKLPHRGSLEEACLDMPPINLENHTARSVNTQLSECNPLMSQDDTGSQFDSLSHVEQEEELKLKVLDKELNDFLTFNSELNTNIKEKMHGQCQHLKDIFKAVETEKAMAYRKLDFIRRQLIDLESSSSEGINDCDSGFHSKSENDQDAKILDSVRRRLSKLKETIFDLKKHVQKLELENSELSTSLQSEKSFSQLNSSTIKQVADLLCEIRGKQFSCTDIYNNTQAGMNPFCEVIIEMQKEFKERELQVLHLVGMRNKRIDELTQALINKEKTFSDQQRCSLNESLKCQNAHLQRTISEREQHICKLSGMLKSVSQSQFMEPSSAVEYGYSHNSYCDELEKKIESLKKKLDKSNKQEHFFHGEIRKLNEELIESKRKNNELLCQSQRLAALLKSQESHRIELAAKYEQVEKNFEEQTKQLRSANYQLSLLNERFQTMENRQAEHNMERKLLREEVLALKEKEGCLMAKHKTIQEQFLKTEKELYLAHDVIKEQQCILHQKENAHSEMVKRLQETNIDVKRKLTDLTDHYKKLEQEYDQKTDLIKRHENLIGSFRKWKDTQVEAEERTREGFKYYENAITVMLEDKQKSLELYHDLQREYILVQNELERYKGCSFSNSNHNTLHNPSERSIAERLALVRQTTQRVSEQTSSFKEEEPPPARWDVATRGKPSEELL